MNMRRRILRLAARIEEAWRAQSRADWEALVAQVFRTAPGRYALVWEGDRIAEDLHGIPIVILRPEARGREVSSIELAYRVTRTRPARRRRRRR